MTEKHAVIEQLTSDKTPTRGVSTTTTKQIAFEKYAINHGMVVLIDRTKLKHFRIKEYIVKEILHPSQILNPEDDEVILVYEKDGAFPKGIIIEVIDINA